MLDGLLGRGFSSKCKSLIRPTRTRIDVLRRRKEATQRFLKGSLAQLLSNGLDINAFGRTEEFLAGLNVLACYDFLEQSCEHILKKLSMMQKHSECPEECREAVGSLMFAAARFSDLPELRDLRDALQERYGNSLEHFVNQEFVERLAMKPPTIDKKIQLLQDISLELSIKWDSRGFQQRMMANSSAPAQNQVKKQDCDATYNFRIDNQTAVNSNRRDHLLKEKSELTSDSLKAKNGGENYFMRKDELDHRSFGVIESTGNSVKPRIVSEQNNAKRVNYERTPRGRREKSELSNGLQANYGRENSFMRKDESDILLFERGDYMGNICKSHNGLEKSTHRRENNGIIPEGEFNSDGQRGKTVRDNYLMKKNVLDHLSFGRGDSTSNNLMPHFDSDKSTAKKGIYDISPRHIRELSGDKNEPTRMNGKHDYFQKRRDGHGSSSRGKSPDGTDEQSTSQKRIYDTTPPRHRRAITDTKNDPSRINGNEDSVHRRERNESSSCEKKTEITNGLYEAQNQNVYGFHKSSRHGSIADDKELPIIRENKIVSSASNRDYEEPNYSKSPRIIQEENTDKLKPISSYALPPPYVKSKDKLVPPPYTKTVEGKKAISDDILNYDDMRTGHARMRSHDHEKDVPYFDNIPLPKPRSIRKKHSKSSSNREDFGNSEDSEVLKRSSTSRRRDHHHHSKKGLQILLNEDHKHRDDEERKIDKLLLHYSKKPVKYDEEKVRRKVKPHAREAPQDGFDERETSGFHTRSVSLPREQTNSDEQVKLYARANSFQPDKPAGHVHPKLPDYDDLAARFAALKGR